MRFTHGIVAAHKLVCRISLPVDARPAPPCELYTDSSRGVRPPYLIHIFAISSHTRTIVDVVGCSTVRLRWGRMRSVTWSV